MFYKRTAALLVHRKLNTSLSLRIIFRECRRKNVGVAGYAEAFAPVLSENWASETGSYLMNDVLGPKKDK